MFHKYNLVLRGGPGVTDEEEAEALMLKRFNEECKGNTYVTTLHVRAAYPEVLSPWHAVVRAAHDLRRF